MENPQPYELDSTGDYPVVIESEHHKIHEGKHFSCQDVDSDVDGVKYWHIKTPNTATRIHLVFKTILSKNGLVELYKAPNLNTNGIALTMFNDDDNSSNTPEALCYKDPDVNTDGTTRRAVNVIGTDSASPIGASGGLTARSDEIILEQNTSYIIKATALNTNTRISNCFKWYEVVPET